MKPDVLLQELETAASSLKVKVSYEALRSSVGMGGLCRVKGQYRVIIDKRANARERVAALAEALSRLDTTSAELSAPAREVVDYYGLRQAS